MKHGKGKWRKNKLRMEMYSLVQCDYVISLKVSIEKTRKMGTENFIGSQEIYLKEHM